MQAIVTNPLFEQIRVRENLLPYLLHAGWRQVDNDNPKWIVVNGREDVEGKPLKLVFPKDATAEDDERYAAKALNALALINDRPLDMLIRSVVNYDRDQFYLRNIESIDGRIPLNTASKQIVNLQTVIAASAVMEKASFPLPYSYDLRSGRKLASAFGFAHTAPGSFCFVIQAPRLDDPVQFKQQTLFDFDGSQLPEEAPFQRRVVERIARGLILAKKSEQEHDHQILLKGFASGLNGNMCSALTKMVDRRGPELEWIFDWAPKVDAGSDLAERPTVKLRKDGYDNLAWVADKLKTETPRRATISGHVRGLESSDNPSNVNSKRAVVIRAVLPETNRASDVIVRLDLDSYRKATDAHEKWVSVSVEGILSRSGSGWRLLDATNFKTAKS